MPCLNEEKTIAACISEAQDFIQKSGVDAEIVVADNGSTDGSAALAMALGARVAAVPEKGYGNALIGGIAAANGKYIIMGDCDGSYPFSNLSPFLTAFENGADLVVGNRFAGMEKGAMPFLHKYFGVPFLSYLARVKFHSSVCDFHCGLRGITQKAAKSLNFQCGGMEFATEMIAKAARADLSIAEVPVFYRRDSRCRKSHLRPFRDALRHIFYILRH